MVDHLFRRQAGRMVAVLTRSLGAAHLDLAEEVVQEALVQALRRWPFMGVPDNPAGWLYRVARNLALDRLRRDARFRERLAEIRRHLPEADEPGGEPALAGEMTHDQLRLIFLCCHPEIPRDGRVALTLKAVCGFGVREIARAFLVRETTVAQRLVRAQRRIRERGLPLEVPGPEEITGRLDSVLEVLYLVFNEGYAAHAGDDLVREGLCRDALAWCEHLAAAPSTRGPAVHALAALLCFQASRLPARVDAGGNLVLLEDQDRGLWDRPLIARGFRHLERASAGETLDAYHVQAAIAAHHAGAPAHGDTDWPAILALYDRLLEMNPSPVVALNRAVALAQVEGPAAGLEALEAAAGHPALAGYALLPATRGELHRRLGEHAAAAACYREALGRPCSEPERRFLMRRLDAALSARS